tara:strand:+ start:688 stop:831 length:144 start_codon:yes stop_codon:yes gene_type:complete
MNIQFEWIKGFILGIDYVEDIEILPDQFADLLRIHLGFFWINIFMIR